MSKYITISKQTREVFSTGETKKEAIEKLSRLIIDEEVGHTDFHILEVIDTISVQARQVVETTITSSDGREMKLDSRDRLVPTERVRASSEAEKHPEEELDVDNILEQVGLSE